MQTNVLIRINKKCSELCAVIWRQPVLTGETTVREGYNDPLLRLLLGSDL